LTPFTSNLLARDCFNRGRFNEGPYLLQVERMKYNREMQQMRRELRRVEKLVVQDELIHIKPKKNEFYFS
jgi:hypothetical protein